MPDFPDDYLYDSEAEEHLATFLALLTQGFATPCIHDSQRQQHSNSIPES